MFKVLLTHRAIKDINNLPKTIQDRIYEKLKEYSVEPLKYARKLIDPRIGTYRIRVGKYRLVFDVEDDKMIILRVGHRKSIYK